MRDARVVLHQRVAHHYVSDVLHCEDWACNDQQGALMSRPFVLATIVVAAAAVLSGCAMNQHQGMQGSAAVPMGASAATRLSAADMAFVQTAAGNDMYEIEISRLATGRAPDAAVKRYAQMLINHHTMTTNEL